MALAKTLTIEHINIGSVQVIGHRGEGPVWSGFNKTPVAQAFQQKVDKDGSAW